MVSLEDKYGRTFKTLRVSLTDACNLACKYCVPDGIKAEKLDGNYSKTNELLLMISDLRKHLNLTKIRFTGGEPLLHKDIAHIIKETKKMGFDDIAITTNGLGIDKKIESLVEAGLKSINISLDSSNAAVFETITGFNHFHKTLKAIDKCVELGLKVKLNTVILKNQNEDEILPLLELAQRTNIEIRFLELMKMGKVKSYFEHFFVSAQGIKEIIQKKYSLVEIGRPNASTTRYYKLNNNYSFGIIENVSTPFCKDCDRLRLGSDMKLYGCITASEGIDVKDISFSDELLSEALQKALNQKQDFFIGSEKSMIKVGG